MGREKKTIEKPVAHHLGDLCSQETKMEVSEASWTSGQVNTPEQYEIYLFHEGLNFYFRGFTSIYQLGPGVQRDLVNTAPNICRKRKCRNEADHSNQIKVGVSFDPMSSRSAGLLSPPSK